MMDKALRGFDLHRVIRYAYPGFLLVAIALVVAPNRVKPVLDAAGAVVAPLAITAVGAAIYVFYRHFLQELFISPLFTHPVHSLLDRRSGTTNPANYVATTFALPSRHARHAAYVDIRRGFFDAADKEGFNMNHTEATVVWITAVEFLGAGVWLLLARVHVHPGLTVFFLAAGIVLGISSVAIDIRLYREECRILRAYEDRAPGSLRRFLEVRGYLLPSSVAAT